MNPRRIITIGTKIIGPICMLSLLCWSQHQAWAYEPTEEDFFVFELQNTDPDLSVHHVITDLTTAPLLPKHTALNHTPLSSWPQISPQDVALPLAMLATQGEYSLFIESAKTTIFLVVGSAASTSAITTLLQNSATRQYKRGALATMLLLFSGVAYVTSLKSLTKIMEMVHENLHNDSH